MAGNLNSEQRISGFVKINKISCTRYTNRKSQIVKLDRLFVMLQIRSWEKHGELVGMGRAAAPIFVDSSKKYTFSPNATTYH